MSEFRSATQKANLDGIALAAGAGVVLVGLLTRVIGASSLTIAVLGILLITWIAAEARGTPMGLLAPGTLLIAGGAVYTLPSAITAVLQGDFTDDRGIEAGAQLSASILAATTLGVTAVATTLLRGLRGGPAGPPRGEIPSRQMEFIGASAAVTGAAMVLTFIMIQGGPGAFLSVPYGERYIMMRGYGPLLVGLLTVNIGAIVGLCAVTSRPGWRRQVIWLLAPIAFDGFWVWIMGSRAQLAILLAGQFVAWQLTSRWRLPMAWVILGGVPVYVIGAAVGFLRAGDTDVRAIVDFARVAQFNPANLEFGSAIGTVADIISTVPVIEPYRFGSTYLGSLGGIVPLFLWPSRPSGAAEWYVRQYYPDVAAAGGGFAFSPIAEAYLNFGFVGVIGLGLLLGYLANRVLRSLSAGSFRSPAAIAIYAVAAPNILMFWRFDFGGFIKQVMLMTVIQAVFWLRSGTLLISPPRRERLPASSTS